MTDRLRETLVNAGRVLVSEDLGDYVAGHVTARLPGEAGRFLMKPAAIGLDEMTPDNLVTIDIEGTKVAGDMPRHSEVFIHTEIMRVRKDVNCVVHTHPPDCVVFGSLGKKMQPIGHHGALFCEALPVFSKTSDLIRTPDLGRAVAKQIGKFHVLLLRNHGIVATGTCVEEAIMRALFLDSACKQMLSAEAAGGARLVSKRADWVSKQKNMIPLHHSAAAFEHLVRKLPK
jgi:L-fuculose-phosphate aldolase